MAITDTLVLPKDVLLVPVAELATTFRATLDCRDDDYAVTRPNGRQGSAIVDSKAAGLVCRLFK